MCDALQAMENAKGKPIDKMLTDCYASQEQLVRINQNIYLCVLTGPQHAITMDTMIANALSEKAIQDLQQGIARWRAVTAVLEQLRAPLANEQADADMSVTMDSAVNAIEQLRGAIEARLSGIQAEYAESHAAYASIIDRATASVAERLDATRASIDACMDASTDHIVTAAVQNVDAAVQQVANEIQTSIATARDTLAPLKSLCVRMAYVFACAYFWIGLDDAR